MACLLCWTALALEAPAHECDSLAAHPLDAGKVGAGVDWDALDAQRALAVCEAAVRDHPDVARFEYQLGRALHRSNDLESAADRYAAAAGKGHAIAAYILGAMYAEGQGVQKDDAEALRWTRMAAEQGVAMAQSNLGNMYFEGRGVAQNDAEASRWYREAAEQGYAPGQVNLGDMHFEGRGVSRDDTEAYRWYRQAAEQGLALAQAKVGYLLATGRGVARDDAEALRWTRLAAEQGNTDARKNLGLMYREGRGVEKDEAEALRWLRESASQGPGVAEKSPPGSPSVAGGGVPARVDVAARRSREAGAPLLSWGTVLIGVLFIGAIIEGIYVLLSRKHPPRQPYLRIARGIGMIAVATLILGALLGAFFAFTHFTGIHYRHVSRLALVVPIAIAILLAQQIFSYLPGGRRHRLGRRRAVAGS